MIKSTGVLHCAEGNENGRSVCRNTLEHPPAMHFNTVRRLAAQAQWTYRGSSTGWAWLCPAHAPDE